MKAAFAVLIVLGLILSIVPVATAAVEEDVRVLTLPANATMVFEAEPGVLKLLLFNTTVRLELEFSNGTIATVNATDVILGDAVKRATVHTLETTEIVEFSTQATEEVEMGSGIVELSYSGGVNETVVELVLEPGYSYAIEFERTKPAVFLEDAIIIDCGGWWSKVKSWWSKIKSAIANAVKKVKRVIRRIVLPIIRPILPPPTKVIIQPIFKEKHYVKIPEPKKPKKIMIIKPPHVRFKVWRFKPIADGGVPRTVTVTQTQTVTVTVVPQHVQPQPQLQAQTMPMAGVFDLQNLASNPLAIIVIVLFIVVLIALLR